MRVLINAASANMGGAFTYLQNLLGWMPELAASDQFFVCVPEHTRDKLEETLSAPNLKFLTYPYAETGGAARLYFDQVRVPRLIRQQHIEVLFSSTGFGTFWKGCPELLLVRNPVYFSKAFEQKYRELGRSLHRNTLRRWHSLFSISRADGVLFPTRAMKGMVEQYIELAQKDSRAIHYGFDHERFWCNGGSNSESLRDVQQWRDEGYQILLNVSTYAVHKNFETLIEALPHLNERANKVKLLTTTSRDRTKDKGEYDALKRYALDQGVDRAWVELGYVPYHDLSALYRAADLYVFPSFTESFGHTLVEAMAAGLPVVAADMAVNREVCGEAGRYFAPFEPTDCARSITALLSHDEQRQAMGEASKKRAQHFSWKRYTSELVHVLQSMAHQG
jgi:glycosyltransferase involved in cell wall biosynthesis